MKTLLDLWSRIKKWFCPKSIVECQGNCECGVYQPTVKSKSKPKPKPKAKIEIKM
jgi:hypothetical protein